MVRASTQRRRWRRASSTGSIRTAPTTSAFTVLALTQPRRRRNREDTIRRPVALALFLSSLLTTGAAQSRDARLEDLLQTSSFKSASAFIDGNYHRFVRELVTLTEIPAPPFKEAVGAKAFSGMLREAGLSEIEVDEEGNVLGVRKGGGRGLLAVVGRLDTVFPGGTDVKVKRDGTELLAPGVSDDSRGLAVMLAAVRAINRAGIDTDADLLFVGSVGEEGEGDLRGVRYLFDKGKYRDRITAFLAIDGPDPGPPRQWCTRQQTVSGHLQGSWWAQLQRIRSREPCLCDGRRDSQARCAQSAAPRRRRSTSAW